MLASGKVEEKLDEYLAKIGLEDGLFVYTFNADGIIDFLARISSSAGDSKLKALNALISQYDDMKIGFELKRKN